MDSADGDKLPAMYHGLAGLLAGAIATSSLHPLDLVKTRFQVQDAISATTGTTLQGRVHYKNTLHAFRTIIAVEGVRALYQGLVPNVIGASASWGLYLYFYSHIKAALHGMLAPTQQTPGPLIHLLSGIAAGMAAVVITNPVWVTKTRLQLQVAEKPGSYKGFLDCLLTTAREEGIVGLYKGLVPALVGTSHGALQFMAYEWMRKHAARHSGSEDNMTSAHYIVMGGISKIFASVATYPYQVIRSRLQERGTKKYDGVIDAVIKTWRNEKLRGFYRGVVPATLRVTPASAITFLAYENLIKIFKQLRRNEPS